MTDDQRELIFEIGDAIERLVSLGHPKAMELAGRLAADLRRMAETSHSMARYGQDEAALFRSEATVRSAMESLDEARKMLRSQRIELRSGRAFRMDAQ